MSDTKTKEHVPPEFPVPEFTQLSVMLGASRDKYLAQEKLGQVFYSGRHPMCDVAHKLFFEGGRIEDFGIRFRPGIDRPKAFAAIRALLCSFEPSHEIKIGTVGLALSQWTEPIPVEAKPVKPTKHKGGRKTFR